MTRLSVLIPTRKRVGSLGECIMSLERLWRSEKNVEIIVGYDSDDEATEHFVGPASPFPVTLVRTEPSDHLTHLHNLMASRATGDYLWIFGDDLRVVTQDWDAKIIDGMDAYLADKPDRIAVADVEDDAPPPPGVADFCCFPVITREAVNAMGFFFDPRLATWGADVWLGNVFSAIGRIADLKHVAVKNLTYWNGSAVRDETSHLMEARYHKHYGALQQAMAEVPVLAWRLKEKMAVRG